MSRRPREVQRALQPSQMEKLAAVNLAGRASERSDEGIAESAMRVETARENGRVERHSFSNLVQRAGQPSCPSVGVECHAIAALEVATDGGRIDAARGEIALPDAHAEVPARCRPSTGGTKPARHLPALAGTVCTGDSRPRQPRAGRKVLDVLRKRFSSRTCGPAENPGRPHAQVEETIECGVTLQIRVHAFQRRAEVSSWCSYFKDTRRRSRRTTDFRARMWKSELAVSHQLSAKQESLDN